MMDTLPEGVAESVTIGSGSSEWLVSARKLEAFQARGLESCGTSRVRPPYRIVRFHPPFAHLVVGLEGVGEVWFDGAWRRLRPGMVFFNPPDHAEAIRAVGSRIWRFSWVHIQRDALPPVRPSPRLERRDARGFRLALEGLEIADRGDSSNPLLKHWCELVWMHSMLLVRKSDQIARLVQLWEAVKQEPDADWTITQLARKARISRAHLRRTALAETGRAPMQQVAYLRMQRAADLLLSSERTIDAVSEAVGYANPYVFSNAFKRWMGERPGAFRRSHGPAAGVVLRPELGLRRFALAEGAKPAQWIFADLTRSAAQSLTRAGEAWFDGRPFPALPPEIRGLYGVPFRPVADRATGDCRMLVLSSRAVERPGVSVTRSAPCEEGM